METSISQDSKISPLDRVEFAKVMGFLALGCGHSLSRERTEVYYAMLGDLPMAALMVAAKQALLEPNFSAFPTIEKLRRLASESITPPESRMSGVEAWGIAMKALGSCDVEVDGSVERAFKNVPALVHDAVKRFGFMELYNLPSNGIETCRAHFIRLFESLAATERSHALLPASLKHEMAEIQPEPTNPAVLKLIAGIGDEK